MTPNKPLVPTPKVEATLLAAQRRRYALSVLLSVSLLCGGCVAMNPAVRECEGYLGKDVYSVVEVEKLKAGGIWQMLNTESIQPGTLLFDDWHVHWPRMDAWGKQPSITLVLLEKAPDTLVYCEVSICTPRITWLKRMPSTGGYDKWQLEKTNENEQICVVE